MKWRVNEEKVLRNILVISSIVSLGMLVYKIANCGFAWISTCGYFG